MSIKNVIKQLIVPSVVEDAEEQRNDM